MIKTKLNAIVVVLCMLSCSCTNGQGKKSNDKGQQYFELPSVSLEKAGFNRDSIENIINLINATAHKAFRGLVVIKDNQIVIEEYFNTFWRNSILDIRSAGKSVTTLLLGIALKEGLIESIDQSVYSLFSEKINNSVNEEYKNIKLRHLLDMSSGLDADSDDSSSAGQAGQWIARDDWKEYVLNIPLKSQPGQSFVYADINPLLVGLAIEEASGMSLKDYAKEKLFDPLGIKQFYWYTNAANQTGAAGNLYLSALDFAKLGTLVVNEGKWANQQIVNPEFIELLIQSNNAAISKSWTWVDYYGMFWYRRSATIRNEKVKYLYGSGLGGNHLVVFPTEEMVIALASSAYGQPYQHGRSEAIMEKILNAIE